MNSPGPFYVVDGCCTACGVPFVEAPNLFAYDNKNHCYVKRQPIAKAETNSILRAAWAAELACIRYSGDDPEMLRRFAEFGSPELCDVAPSENIRPAFRNHVTFDSSDPAFASLTATHLATAFRDYLQSLKRDWLTFRFTPINQEGASASFDFAWFENNFHRVEFKTINLPDCRWLIRYSSNEKLGSRSVSNTVDDWLKSDDRFRSIRWYTEDAWMGAKQ